MAYLSCGVGAFVATKTNIKRFKQILKDHFDLNEKTGKCDFNVYMSTHGSASIVVFKFNDWSWCDASNEVKAIDDFIEESNFNAGLIVVGEDNYETIYGDPGMFELYSNMYIDESSVSTNLGCPSFMKKKVHETSGVELVLDGSDIELLKQKKDEFEE